MLARFPAILASLEHDDGELVAVAIAKGALLVDEEAHLLLGAKPLNELRRAEARFETAEGSRQNHYRLLVFTRIYATPGEKRAARSFPIVLVSEGAQPPLTDSVPDTLATLALETNVAQERTGSKSLNLVNLLKQIGEKELREARGAGNADCTAEVSRGEGADTHPQGEKHPSSAANLGNTCRATFFSMALRPSRLPMSFGRAEETDQDQCPQTAGRSTETDKPPPDVKL